MFCSHERLVKCEVGIVNYEEIKESRASQDDLVRRWFENLQARSAISADIRLRTFSLYCRENNLTPRDILAQALDKTLKYNFEDFVRELERKGKAGSYLIKFKFVLKSWLDYNNIEYRLKINIGGEHETPTTMKERIPLKEELTNILMFADSRTKGLISGETKINPLPCISLMLPLLTQPITEL